MEICFKKVNKAVKNKLFQSEIVLLGKKIRDRKLCCDKDNCQFDVFVSDLSNIVNNKKDEHFDNIEKVIFADIFKKHTKKFLVCDQIFKKFSTNFFEMEEDYQQAVIGFEIDKVKDFIHNIATVKLLTDKHFTVVKTFL